MLQYGSGKSAGRSRESESPNALLPILSLMLILIPVLLGNIAFVHLGRLDVVIPTPSKAGRTVPKFYPGTVNVVYYLTLKPLESLAQLVEESTGKVITESKFRTDPLSLKQVQQDMISMQKGHPSLNTIFITAEENVRFDQILAVIESCHAFQRTAAIPLEVVLLPLGGA